MVPSGWKASQIGDIAKFSSGGTPSKQNAEYWGGTKPWISGKDLKTHYLSNSIDTLTEEGFKVAKKAPKGSSLILVRGMTLLKDFPVGYATKDVAFNQDLKALVPAKNVDGLFLSFLLVAEKHKIRQLVSTAGHGTGRLDTQSIQEYPINLPPLSEQAKIAQILSTWDKAITTTEQLLVNSQQQKKALMQQLLTGKKRLLDENGVRFSGEWKATAISKFIKESRVGGNGGDIAKKITVKLYGNGVVAKDEKRVGSESTKYYRRSAGQFIYSKLDFLNGAFGIIPKQLDDYESTLDLPAFDFLEGVCIGWFVYFVSREEFYTANLGLANGGRKARRVNPNDLLKIRIPTPTLEEQQKIAAVLSTADQEITALQQKLNALKQEKKALMQQLLTGKRRVKIQ